MKAKSSRDEHRPLVILVQQESFIRLWLERKISAWFRVCVFSTPEEALAFIRSASSCDVLITDLDLGSSALGGCNIARKVQRRFPEASIFVFSNGAGDDHRLAILRGMRSVVLMAGPFDGFFVAGKVRAALAEKVRKRG